MKVVIRTDASLQIGTGHVMRCMTLANALNEKGVKVQFICRDHVGNLIKYIQSKGYLVHTLETYTCNSADNTETENRNEVVLFHAHWLGVSWQQDAKDTTHVIGDEKPDWLVADHYGLDARWHGKLRDHVNKILVIDDLSDRTLDCDLLLDQNYYHAPSERYHTLVRENCRCLFGPNYAMLRPEFMLGIGKDQKRSRTKLERIIVFMGGADVTNETKKAILAMDLVTDCQFKADIIVGSINPHAAGIKKLCDEREYAVFHQNVRNIAELMNKADLAIGGGGATTLERCYLGLPSLVLTLAENQKESISDLESIGAIESLGWYADLQVNMFADRLRSYCHHPEKLELMSEDIEQVLSQKNYRGVNGVVELMQVL